jgi:hypothetical protein
VVVRLWLNEDFRWWLVVSYDGSTTNDDGQGKPSHTTSKQPATNINHLHLKNDNVVMFKPDCFIVQKDLQYDKFKCTSLIKDPH